MSHTRGSVSSWVRSARLITIASVAACSSSGVGPEHDCSVPAADLAACETTADCATVTGGCYCGAQPLSGVAIGHAAAAQACEAAAAEACALGCANEPGFRAQDGDHADSSAMILVECVRPGAALGTCTTYVP